MLEGWSALRQISFPYDGNTNELSVTFNTEMLLPFFAEHAKELPFTFDEIDTVRELLFSMGRDSNIIPISFAQKNIESAILGVVDLYTLGELDDMSIDFRMWADRSGFVPDGSPGADGTSIFSYVDPLFFLFQFVNKYQGSFNVGDLFIDERGLVAKQIYLYLKTHDRLAQLLTEKMIDGSTIAMLLKQDKITLESYLTLFCKSLLGHEWTLGEMDPLTLGYFDPQSLWSLSKQTASVLNLTTASAAVEGTLEPQLIHQNLILHVDSKPIAEQTSFVSATSVSKRLAGNGYRGLALLEDIDDFTFSELDTRILGMHFYKKTPAIVTAE